MGQGIRNKVVPPLDAAATAQRAVSTACSSASAGRPEEVAAADSCAGDPGRLTGRLTGLALLKQSSVPVVKIL